MTPLAALRSATIDAARLLGAQDELGTLAAGKYADIVAVASDPSRDISALRQIRLVIKGGRIYRNTF
jgi:imidazolonepropionase-like amidohydrolase